MGEFLRNWKIICFILVGALSLFFQNCAGPKALPSSVIDSSNRPQIPGGTNTERLPVHDGGDALPFLPGQSVFSTSHRVGTAQDEYAYSLFPTQDGGYISTGLRRIDNQSDLNVFFQKWDSLGAQTYAVDIGDSETNAGYRAIELPGSYLIVGVSTTPGEEENFRRGDMLALKVSKESGEIVRARQIGTPTGYEVIHDVVLADVTFNPTLYVVGYYRPFNGDTGGEMRAMVAKLDTDLNVLWQRDFAEPGVDLNLFSIAYSSSYGLYVAGYRESGATRSPLLMRLTNNGDVVVSRHLEVPAGVQSEFAAIENSGRDLVIAGYYSEDDNSDGLLARVSYEGALSELKTIGTADQNESLRGVKITRNGGLALHGVRGAIDSPSRSWLTQLDASGGVTFSRQFAGSHSEMNAFQSLLIRSDGGYSILSSEQEAGGNGHYSPRLRLLNQNGELGSSCSDNVTNVTAAIGTRSDLFLTPVFTSTAQTVMDITDIFDADDDQNFAAIEDADSLFCEIGTN